MDENQPLSQEEEELIQQKIKKVDEILESFYREIEPLEREQREIINRILERVNQEKLAKIKKVIENFKKTK